MYCAAAAIGIPDPEISSLPAQRSRRSRSFEATVRVAGRPSSINFAEWLKRLSDIQMSRGL